MCKPHSVTGIGETQLLKMDLSAPGLFVCRSPATADEHNRQQCFLQSVTSLIQYQDETKREEQEPKPGSGAVSVLCMESGLPHRHSSARALGKHHIVGDCTAIPLASTKS